MFMASMDKKAFGDFETWLDGLSTDIKANTSYDETMIAANRVNWFLSEEQEQVLISSAITDHVCQDIMVKAHTFYNVLKETILLPEKKHTATVFDVTPEVSGCK